MIFQVIKKQNRHSVTTTECLRILWIAALSVALGGCAWLQTQQRLLIYRPTVTETVSQRVLTDGERHYFVELPHSAPAQRLAFWWLPNASPQAPTLLYFHGTFRNLEGNQRKLQSLRTAGFSVLAVDYRGWGESSRMVPSESSILQDADIAWAQLKAHQPAPTLRVIYGHSMGSGVAVDLASRVNASDYGFLVLESAFTSFSDIARKAGWLTRLLDWFNPERFDSLSKITRVHVPLLMLHGDQDTTVAIELGKALFDAANSPKHWVAMEGGGHSDLDQVNPALYRSTLHRFITTRAPPALVTSP